MGVASLIDFLITRRGEQMTVKLDTTVFDWTASVDVRRGGREAQFPLTVCVFYQQGNRGKHDLLVMAYLTWDMADRMPKKVEASPEALSDRDIVPDDLWNACAYK